MELRAAGLQEQPFRSRGQPLVFVSYNAQEEAFKFFEETYKSKGGIGLFQGPSLSGKSTIIRQFAEAQSAKIAVAIVDGSDMDTESLLETMLSEFGFEHKFNSVNELINMSKVFILQQTAAGKSPFCFIENTHAMNPGALHVLCELAKLRVREKFALRLILASDRPIHYITEAPAMEGIAKRHSGDFHLAALSMDEVTDYLFAKMRSGGCFDPENVFPEDVCDALHASSGGWPGIVDRLALLAIAKAEYCPVRAEHIENADLPAVSPAYLSGETGDSKSTEAPAPVLYLTRNGKTIRKILLEGPRMLIGRSEHNDLFIDSNFVSRHHALLVRQGPATLLMDLNSSNGTFINSRRMSDQVLLDNDIITIGDFGIKFVDPAAKNRAALESMGFTDTVVMKSLDDMRRVLAKENTQVMPAPARIKEAGGNSD